MQTLLKTGFMLTRFSRFGLYNFATAKHEIEIKSVPNHKPPISEDSIPGKYAGVLFSSASKKEALHLVLQDIKWFKELCT